MQPARALGRPGGSPFLLFRKKRRATHRIARLRDDPPVSTPGLRPDSQPALAFGLWPASLPPLAFEQFVVGDLPDGVLVAERDAADLALVTILVDDLDVPE